MGIHGCGYKISAVGEDNGVKFYPRICVRIYVFTMYEIQAISFNVMVIQPAGIINDRCGMGEKYYPKI